MTLIGIALVPLYVKYMGASAYGLVGFFTVLQILFNLLDFGLSPMIARESAGFRGKALSALNYLKLVRALIIIFLAIGLLAGGVLFVLSEQIASWFNSEELSQEVLVLAVQIMAISITLRWLSGLFRGIITGAERIVWLSGFASCLATLRFVAVFASMELFGFTPTVFFVHQLIVAIIELVVLCLFGLRLLPPSSQFGHKEIGWRIAPVFPLLKFSLGIAFNATVWILVTQLDKLILSGVLPLNEYGYFTLAVLAANGVLFLYGPITQSILPRMARLNAEDNVDAMFRLYKDATQLVVVTSVAASLVIAVFSDSFLLAWTGNPEIAERGAIILTLYALGNGFLVLGALPYSLQYATGNVNYNSIGSLLTLCLMIPSLVFFSMQFGAKGAGWTWLTFHALGVLLWSAFVHSKIAPGIHLKWVLNDILKIALPVLLICLGGSFIFENPTSRLNAFFEIVVVSFLIFVSAVLLSNTIRNKAIAFFSAQK